MTDIARRFKENPLLLPKDLKSSNPNLQVISLLNPGVFTFEGKIWLLVRVAESSAEKEGVIFFPVMNATGNTEIVEVPLNAPDLVATDARVIQYNGLDYLTTISHLRLLCSDDGVNFIEPTDRPASLFGSGYLEGYGIEDCRVTPIGINYYLTFTAVSPNGVGVGLRITNDWKHFEHIGMILPPHNKDCAIFEETLAGKFYCLHRPSSKEIGGNYIWLAESPDCIHWGQPPMHFKTRPRLWDSARVGAGAAPIRTDQGWLEIYHGANEKHQYCLGAFLMDLKNPAKVIGRTIEPIMVPTENYELSVFLVM
jgi:predicted GH43/DUF377 family glycosyl hydrolase